MIQYLMAIGIYITLSLVVVGIIFYVFYKYKEYIVSRRKTTRVVLPPSVPPKPPIVIVEGGKATHIGILMEQPQRPVSLYVPVYVAQV